MRKKWNGLGAVIVGCIVFWVLVVMVVLKVIGG